MVTAGQGTAVSVNRWYSRLRKVAELLLTGHSNKTQVPGLRSPFMMSCTSHAPAIRNRISRTTSRRHAAATRRRTPSFICSKNAWCHHRRKRRQRPLNCLTMLQPALVLPDGAAGAPETAAAAAPVTAAAATCCAIACTGHSMSLAATHAIHKVGEHSQHGTALMTRMVGYADVAAVNWPDLARHTSAAQFAIFSFVC